MPRVETRGSQNKIKINLSKVNKARNVLGRPLCCDHCPHCAKKASIATTREQSVIVTSQLLAVGSCIDDVTIGQHFEPFGAVMG